MNCSKKIILTGATGLIGKEAIKPLQEAGYDVYALTTGENTVESCVTWIKCNLFDEQSIKNVFERIKPTYLLNFAWRTTGDYLGSELNYKFVKAGLDMLKYFKENGGKRAVYAGTGFEYKVKDTKLVEGDELESNTLYSKCKNELREKAEIFCKENNISFGWGRIFYVYGHGENETRLTAHIINSLRANKEVIINNGQLIKDYMYTKDIANAFVKFIGTDVCGCVNISTGNGISLEDYATLIAKKINRENLLVIKSKKTCNPAKIVGDNTKLKEEVGYKIEYTLENAIESIINENLN